MHLPTGGAESDTQTHLLPCATNTTLQGSISLVLHTEKLCLQPIWSCPSHSQHLSLQFLSYLHIANHDQFNSLQLDLIFLEIGQRKVFQYTSFKWYYICNSCFYYIYVYMCGGWYQDSLVTV